MRKALIVIFTIGFILTSGCAKSNNTGSNSKDSSTASSLKSSTKSDLNTNKKTNVTTADTVENPFFFKSNVSELNYEGFFLFNDVIKKDVKLHINEVANLLQGKLYELKIEFIEGVPSDRLNLGYFYVQNDKIYKINPTEENLNKLKTSEKVPEDSIIVSQDKEIKDTLSPDEPGWHRYIKVNGDKREYHSYNNQVSTGYYESFIWEKNKGLINYRSGYGAERDSIELKLLEK